MPETTELRWLCIWLWMAALAMPNPLAQPVTQTVLTTSAIHNPADSSLSAITAGASRRQYGDEWL